MVPIYTNSGAMALATLVRAGLEDCVLKLYKAIDAPLSQSSTIDSFTVADFSGYASKTIATFLAPFLDSEGGVSIQSGTQQWDFDGTDLTPTTNTVYGYWLETADGDLFLASQFDAPITMASAGSSIITNVILNVGR